MGQWYMVAHMKKTTINIEDGIMERLKEEAARRNTTMTALIEAGIQRILGEGPAPGAGAAELPPLPVRDMGEPLVDITDREALDEALDQERDERLYGLAAERGSVEPPRGLPLRVRAVAEEPEPYDAGTGAPGRPDDA